jgi:hypothetical protein
VTDCTTTKVEFSSLKRRKVEAEFSGGEITSDGGALLLRAADHQLGLMKRVSDVIEDPRRQELVQHSQLSMLRQRVYGVALGYEDLNDHQTLRSDSAIQTAVDRIGWLASAPTLCRLENSASREGAVAIHQVMIEQFIDSFDTPPKELILDFDATDDPIHGDQEGRFFHGYYDHYCFLPLYVFCGDQLLVSYLRPSNIDGAKHSWAILSLLVKRLRQQWPTVKIIFRGDSGFCRHRILSWCERNNVDFIVGLAGNSRLKEESNDLRILSEGLYKYTKQKQREFDSFRYGAKSWSKQRRVIAKAEYSHRGENLRFIVTNLKGNPQRLYDKVYCARGEMENRIKEQQMGLLADRTSASYWWANQWRVLLSRLAYILLEHIRSTALKKSELAKAQVWTIRNKLLKVGGVIIRNTRRIRFLLSSSYPYKELFERVAEQLQPQPG